MEAPRGHRSMSTAWLAGLGVALAALAACDKVFGLIQRPLALAVGAYAALITLLVVAYLRGWARRASERPRLSADVALALGCLLSAGLLFAWRAISADSAPLLLTAQIAQGDALLSAGRKDEAHLIYREAYRRFPNSYAVLMRLGAVNYQVADYPHAERYFQRALQVAPGDGRWRALNDLGQTYWKLGRAQDAIRNYLAARQAGLPSEKADLIEWHYRLGWAYFDVRDYDAAIEHYEAVAQYGEKYADASYYNVACALAQKMKAAPKSERAALAGEAVSHLREAWRLTRPDERAAFRASFTGSAEQRDPELAPLANTPQLRAFLRAIGA